MAGDDRQAASALAQRLEKAPYSFHFFQAARWIECVHPDQPRIGRSQRPSEDPVHFGQDASLAFAPSAITAYLPATDRRQAELTLSFFGMLGPHGPLPLHLTEHARDRLKNQHDPTFVKFLDVFNHRMASLFYRAWACNQQAVSYDRPDEDRFAAYIGSMIGIGDEPFLRRDAVADNAKRYYAGRLACPTRPAEGLRAILGDYFDVPVEIEQFSGHWVTLPPDAQWRLGESTWTGSLGTTAVLGSQIWDCQQKFRVEMGPLTYAQYQRLLPGSDSFKRLVAWVRNCVGDELSWDLRLILMAREVPRARLGSFGELGWSTWVSSGTFDNDVDSIVSNPIAAA